MMNNTTFANIDGIENPVDALFDCYFDSRGCDDERVESAYEKFSHALMDVDPFLIEEIMGAAAELCMEHERTGFIGGVRMGVRFMNVISE